MKNEIGIHDRRAMSVMDGVTKLALLPQMTPEAVFEGAVKGAIVVMLARPSAIEDVAGMLRDMAEALENPNAPIFSVVK